MNFRSSGDNHLPDPRPCAEWSIRLLRRLPAGACPARRHQCGLLLPFAEQRGVFGFQTDEILMCGVENVWRNARPHTTKGRMTARLLLIQGHLGRGADGKVDGFLAQRIVVSSQRGQKPVSTLSL